MFLHIWTLTEDTKRAAQEAWERFDDSGINNPISALVTTVEYTVHSDGQRNPRSTAEADYKDAITTEYFTFEDRAFLMLSPLFFTELADKQDRILIHECAHIHLMRGTMRKSRLRIEAARIEADNDLLRHCGGSAVQFYSQRAQLGCMVLQFPQEIAADKWVKRHSEHFRADEREIVYRGRDVNPDEGATWLACFEPYVRYLLLLHHGIGAALTDEVAVARDLEAQYAQQTLRLAELGRSDLATEARRALAIDPDDDQDDAFDVVYRQVMNVPEPGDMNGA